MRRSASLSGFQIKHGALLAAIPRQPGGVATDRVTGGRFDLDNVSAEIRQDRGGKSASHAPTEVQNQESITRSGHLLLLCKTALPQNIPPGHPTRPPTPP